MKKITLLIILFQLSSLFTSLTAQVPYEKGYIITKSGEKIEGQISNKPFETMSKEVEIKANGKLQKYKAEDLKSVVLGKRQVFESYLINVHYLYNGNLLIVPEYRLLRLIASGELNLYQVELPTSTAFFTAKAGETPQPLYILRSVYQIPKINETEAQLIRVDTVMIDGAPNNNGLIIDKKEYLKSLNKLMTNCPQKNLITGSVKLNKQPIRALVKSYNDCVNKQTSKIYKDRFKIGLGLNYTIYDGMFKEILDFQKSAFQTDAKNEGIINSIAESKEVSPTFFIEAFPFSDLKYLSLSVGYHTISYNYDLEDEPLKDVNGNDILFDAYHHFKGNVISLKSNLSLPLRSIFRPILRLQFDIKNGEVNNFHAFKIPSSNYYDSRSENYNDTSYIFNIGLGLQATLGTHHFIRTNFMFLRKTNLNVEYMYLF